MQNENKVWTIHEIWNQAMDESEPRLVEPRDRVWASELWKQDLDVVLKLKGIQPTNEPNARAIRKMEMGEWFEQGFANMLKRAGILKDSQQRIERPADDKHIAISGRLDFVAGGNIDDLQVEAVQNSDLPARFRKAGLKIVEHLKEKYKEGFPVNVIEFKTSSLMAFERVDASKKPLAGHDLQLFHYVHNLNMAGSIIYFCKDDARMIQIPVMPDDQRLKELYFAKLARIKSYIDSGTLPKKESIILWDADNKKFTQNLNVRYSSYLTRNYKLKDESEYEEVVSPLVSKWNRIIPRILAGKEMTKSNDEHMKDMLSLGFDIFNLLGRTRDNYVELADKNVKEEEIVIVLPTIHEVFAEQQKNAEI